jgi:hypothetical protein
VARWSEERAEDADHKPFHTARNAPS